MKKFPAMLWTFSLPLPENKKEILIIDDGSRDDTFEKIRALAGEFPFIKVYRHKKILALERF